MKDKKLGKDFLSVKEFAKLVNIHTNTVYKAIAYGRLAAFRVGGGKRSVFRIPATETERMALCDLRNIINTMKEI